MARKTTPLKIWKLYQKYDYMGEDSQYKKWIFRDNGMGEMAVINKKTGNQIESISMSIISKKEFLNLMRRMNKKNPKNLREWLSD